MGRVHSYESLGTVDGPGVRFVVFMQGCPMRCRYCHNPDTWAMAEGREVSAQEVFCEALKYKRYFGKKGGVTVTGGEPLVQIDFLIELFTLLKGAGIGTCIDTSGICFRKDDARYEKLLSLTDLVLLDIKHPDEEEHKKLTGQSGKQPRAFAEYLSEKGVPVWIRYVLVPGITDGEETLLNTRKFLENLRNIEKVEVLPYHTMGAEKYKKLGIPYALEGVLPPDEANIKRAKEILCARYEIREEGERK